MKYVNYIAIDRQFSSAELAEIKEKFYDSYVGFNKTAENVSFEQTTVENLHEVESGNFITRLIKKIKWC